MQNIEQLLNRENWVKYLELATEGGLTDVAIANDIVAHIREALSIADVMAMLPFVTLLEKVNRVEVIDQKGRSYVNWKPTNKTELSLQDDGKTLKVFISN